MEKIIDFLRQPWLYFIILPALLFLTLNVYSAVKYKKGKIKQSAKKEEAKTEPKKDDGKIANQDFYSSILSEIERQNNASLNSNHDEALESLNLSTVEALDDFEGLLNSQNKVDEFKIEEYNYDVCDIKSPEEISWDNAYDEEKPKEKRRKVISKKLQGLTKEQKILLMTNVLNDKKD